MAPNLSFKALLQSWKINPKSTPTSSIALSLWRCPFPRQYSINKRESRGTRPKRAVRTDAVTVIGKFAEINASPPGFFFRYSSSDNVRILVAFLEFCRSFCPNQGALSQNLPDTCSWLEKLYSIMVQRGKYSLFLPSSVAFPSSHEGCQNKMSTSSIDLNELQNNGNNVGVCDGE